MNLNQRLLALSREQIKRDEWKWWVFTLTKTETKELASMDFYINVGRWQGALNFGWVKA